MARRVEEAAPQAQPEVAPQAQAEQLPAAVESKPTALATLPDYGEDAREGFETNDMRDKMIPFLTILQDQSPAIKQKVPGAEIGMLQETVTGTLYSGVLGKCVFLPVYKERKYVAWKPRKMGGGFVGAYNENDEVVLEALKKVGGRPQGPMPIKWGVDDRTGEKVVTVELVETVYVYGMLMNEDGTDFTGPALIAFKSKGLASWRQWNTAMEGLRNGPPLYAIRTRVFTKDDKGGAGDEFKNWRFAPLKDTWMESLLAPDDPLYLEAKRFCKQIKGGTVKVDYEGEAKHTTADESGQRSDEGVGVADEEPLF